MTALNRLSILLLGAPVLLNGLALADDSARARQLLFQVLNRTSKHNVKAIVSQLLPDGSGGVEQFQVIISKNGKIRQTILQPLTMQGVEAVDDLNQSLTYFPDQRRVTIQDSPRRLECDAEFRMALAEKNYVIRLESRNARIAGQTTDVVIAVPRHDELETRKYYIDASTGFLLKLETLVGGATTIRMETKAISYPATIAEGSFELRMPEDVRRWTLRRPEQIDDPQKMPNIGFTPVLARRGERLPLGFRVQDVQVSEGDKVHTVAVRITDGLVKGTVYQMPARGKISEMRAMPGTAMQDAGVLRFIVAADVPSNVREALLRFFAERSHSNIEPMAWGRLALNVGRLELHEVPTAFADDRGLPAGRTFEIRVASPAESIRPAHSLQGKLMTASAAGSATIN